MFQTIQLHRQSRVFRSIKLALIVWISAAVFQTASAQQSKPSDSGELLQQQQAPRPAPVLKQKSLFKLKSLPAGKDSDPFLVSSIELSGNRVIASGVLKKIIKPYENREVTLNELHFLCYEITSHYRDKGYLFSRAVVPQQEIESGIVKIVVLEAKLSEIAISNSSKASSGFFDKIVRDIKLKTIEEKNLNRALLLLQDIPGVNVQASIRAGQALGLSNMHLEVAEAAPKHRLGINNYGSHQTHRARLNGTFSFANMAGRGDLLSLFFNTSGERMSHGSINYSIGLSDSSYGGGSVSYLDYSLGENLKDLNAEGQLVSGSLYFRTNWLRDLSKNLYSQVQLQRQSTDDQLNGGAFQTKRTVDTINFSLSGDVRNWLADASVNSFQLSVTSGDVKFNNAAADQRDTLTANTRGSFNKLNLSIQHQQALSEAWNISVWLSAQKAMANLDSSQKKSMTGSYGVRAYDVGTLTGDSGYLFRAELAHSFAENSFGGVSFYAFIDAAEAVINDNPWQELADDNRISLAGAGLGLRWQGFENWRSQLYVAAPIGNTPAQLSDPKTGILWFEMNTSF